MQMQMQMLGWRQAMGQQMMRRRQLLRLFGNEDIRRGWTTRSLQQCELGTLQQ
jgi:hypothetical protein